MLRLWCRGGCTGNCSWQGNSDSKCMDHVGVCPWVPGGGGEGGLRLSVVEEGLRCRRGYRRRNRSSVVMAVEKKKRMRMSYLQGLGSYSWLLPRNVGQRVVPGSY